VNIVRLPDTFCGYGRYSATREESFSFAGSMYMRHCSHIYFYSTITINQLVMSQRFGIRHLVRATDDFGGILRSRIDLIKKTRNLINVPPL
jgi:hypothetical protein